MPLGKPRELMGLLEGLRMVPAMLPFLRALNKWGKTPMKAYVQRFRDPFLREALGSLFDLPDFPALAAMMTLAWMNTQDAGYPIGGSLEFARSIERRYLDLGGKVEYGARVEKILVEDGRAVGVRLADGAEHRADVVVSAADGYTTLFRMLDGKYADDEIRGYYEQLPIFSSIVQVSLGVARDLSAEPHMVSFPLPQPMTVAGVSLDHLSYKHYCYDPTFAPAGKSVVEVLIGSEYERWEPLAADRERYEAEKQRIADAVIAALDRRFPGLASQVEVVDVATPLTFARYTGNWKGSIEGWLITTKTMGMMTGKGMKKTLPGLDGFFMAGQWVEPGGGLPTAAMSGRNVVQIICDRDKRPFVAQMP
jgi:phytoene dehydrogenase-like protein